MIIRLKDLFAIDFKTNNFEELMWDKLSNLELRSIYIISNTVKDDTQLLQKSDPKKPSSILVNCSKWVEHSPCRLAVFYFSITISQSTKFSVYSNETKD